MTRTRFKLDNLDGFASYLHGSIVDPRIFSKGQYGGISLVVLEAKNFQWVGNIDFWEDVKIQSHTSLLRSTAFILSLPKHLVEEQIVIFNTTMPPSIPLNIHCNGKIFRNISILL